MKVMKSNLIRSLAAASVTVCAIIWGSGVAAAATPSLGPASEFTHPVVLGHLGPFGAASACAPLLTIPLVGVALFPICVV